MSGKLTTDGVQWAADLIANALSGTAMPTTYTHLEVGTGTKGNLAAQTSIALNANAAKGATVIVLKDSAGGTLSGNLVAGDALTFANDDTRYEVATAAAASGNIIAITLTNALVAAKSTGDICTVAMGAASADVGVRTPLPAGGRVQITTGWPRIVTTASGPAIEVKGSLPAGTFTIGTALTEAAIRQNSSGGKCAAHMVLDVAQSPSASQSLDVTLQIPLTAKAGG